MEKSGEEEPAVVMTGDSGAFDFAGMLPGKYDVVLTLPQGYSPQQEDGEIRRTVELTQGDVVDFGTVTMCQSASISGAVHIDDDGDGVIAEGAQPVSDLRVVLLRQERPYRKHRETMAMKTADTALTRSTRANTACSSSWTANGRSPNTVRIPPYTAR